MPRRFGPYLILILAGFCARSGFSFAVHYYFDRDAIDFSHSILNQTFAYKSPRSTNGASAHNIDGISLAFSGPLFAFSGFIDHVAILNSRLDLYDEAGALVGPERCDGENFAARNTKYFGNFERTQLQIPLGGNYFERPICPYLFQNSVVQMLLFYNYGVNRLFRNRPVFYSINSGHKVDLNAVIRSLAVTHIYYGAFTSETFPSVIFSAVASLYLVGRLALVETGFFRGFHELVDLDVVLDNAGEFFHSSTNEWLSTLFDQGVDFGSRQNLLASLTSSDVPAFFSFRLDVTDYSFPERDFCLFRHFPRFKLIAMSITGHFKASCSFKFLSQNNLILQAVLETAADLAGFNESQLDECRFEEKLAVCFNSSVVMARLRASFSSYDVYYALDWIEFIGPVITFPLLAALAFGLNLLVLLIIRSEKNKKDKLFDSKAFRFIEMNSAFNCAECLVYQLRLLGICMGLNSAFCSPWRQTPVVFYLNVTAYFVSETMKSCSIVAGLFFSLQRYIETSQTKTAALVHFSFVSTRRLLIAALVYGLLVSVPELYNVGFAPAFDTYDVPNLNYIQLMNSASIPAAQTYLHFVHFFLNDGVLLLANFAVDCCLVHEIRASLALKQKNMQSWLEQPNEAKKTLEDKKRASIERKTNTLIILSLGIYLFCRGPELASAFLVYYFPQFRQAMECSLLVACSLVSNFKEYMYMLSYIFNILLYYRFNTNFCKGFKNFFALETNIKL